MLIGRWRREAEPEGLFTSGAELPHPSLGAALVGSALTLLTAASVRSVPSEAQYCLRLSSPNPKLGFDSSSQKERDFLHYKISSLRTLLMSCQLFLTGGLSPVSCLLIKTTMILAQDWAVYKMHFGRYLLILKRVTPLHFIVLSLQVLPSCLYSP